MCRFSSAHLEEKLFPDLFSCQKKSPTPPFLAFSVSDFIQLQALNNKHVKRRLSYV